MVGQAYNTIGDGLFPIVNNFAAQPKRLRKTDPMQGKKVKSEAQIAKFVYGDALSWQYKYSAFYMFDYDQKSNLN